MPKFEGLPEDAEVVEYVGLPEGAEVVSEVPPAKKRTAGEVVWDATKATAGLAGGALAEVPQFIYEGAAGTLNGLYRNAWRVAQGVPAVLGGMAGGASFGEAMEQANPVWDEINQRGLPPTLGKGSWLGRGIGAGVNALAQAEAVRHRMRQGMPFDEAMAQARTSNVLADNPRAALFGGDVLAMAGVPWLQRGAAKIASGAAAQAVRHPIQTAKSFIPSAAERAGDLLEQHRQVLNPEEAARNAARSAELAQAQKVLGVDDLPAQVAESNIRMKSLVHDRIERSGNVKVSERQRGEKALAQTEAGLDRIIAPETIDTPRRDFIAQQIESRNRAAKTAADELNRSQEVVGKAGETAAKDAAVRRVVEAADKELAALEAMVTPKSKFDPVGAGARIIQRLRGKAENSTAAVEGEAIVTEAFNKEYARFDGKPEAVASSENLVTILSDAPLEAAKKGNVLKNFVDTSRTRGRLLLEKPGDTTGTIVPENFTLEQFRGIKREYATAANDAKSRGDRAASMEYRKIADAAHEGELAAASRLGDDMFAEYKALSKAYDDIKLRGFNRGAVGALLKPGDAVTKTRFSEEGAMRLLFPGGKAGASNARDLISALGAEQAAKTGRSILEFTVDDITRMGRPEAQKVVRPYIESLLSEVYRQAGGGKAGAKKVSQYLQKNADALNTYGLKFDELQSAAQKYSTTMANLTGAKRAAAEAAVQDVFRPSSGVKASVLPVEAGEIGKYVLEARSPAAAYKDLMWVTNDPVWKPTIKTLIFEELRDRVRAGKDVFADAKAVEAMKQMLTPVEMEGLRAYHTLYRALTEKLDTVALGELKDTLAHTTVKATGGIPVGLGAMYPLKWWGRMLAMAKLAEGDAAALQLLDDALIPGRATVDLNAAFRGSRLAQQKVVERLSRYRRAMDSLQRNLPKAVPGAVATGVRGETNPKE
jgi:hypothetical protein